MIVAPVPNASEMTSTPSQNGPEIEHAEVNNQETGDDWATVEVKRSSRKKNTTPRPMHNNTQHSEFHNTSKKQRGFRNTGIPAKTKKVNRKIVDEVLSSIVERVADEEEARKAKTAVPSPPRVVNSWRNGPPGAKTQQPQVPLSFAAALKAKPTMRDVVAGTHSSRFAGHKTPADRKETQTSTAADPKEHDTPKKPPVVKRTKTTVNSADQNTAPTYQETVSAMSNTSAVPNGSKFDPPTVTNERKSDSSTGFTDEAPQNLDREVAQKDEPIDATPPLPTLLSPENASSATSSVASSLEVTHTRHVHHHHRSPSAADTNDVGYHLLDVCDRLSRDMSLFMSRRALALTIRRRERGALLAALQDCVSEIWPNQCHVQLYGSCATQLDLPASDIDVVVVGFDRQDSGGSPSHGPQSLSQTKSASSESIGTTQSTEELSAEEAQKAPRSSSSQLSAERVMRLAADLESKPWAVRVKAIPGATVPVVKVLADPSRLGHSSGSGEWMERHQHLAAQAAAASGQGPTEDSGKEKETGTEDDSYPRTSLLPWRGSDVMKGLLSLDITFDGIEHGGVGSTEYSAFVVSQLSAPYNVHPDATPFVQVLMVMKELLAQRKLNEPYFGGLSSYALLLLLLALVREREIIRAEIDRCELQKASISCSAELNGGVASGIAAEDRGASKAGQSTPTHWHSPPAMEYGSTSPWDRTGLQSTSSSVSNKVRTTSRNPSPSSWASIARKDHDSTNKTETSKPSPDPTGLPQKLSYAKAAKRRQRQSIPPQESNDSTTSPHESLQDENGTGESSCVTPTCFPQGYNDIVEVLCSGETTAGKLLMHFLLYYGQHFDPQTTAIDFRMEYPNHSTQFAYFSSFTARRTPGTIDPVTGMLTVDPIVVYDPLYYGSDINVARRCYEWRQVRWIFAQSYATLANAVERSKTPPATPTTSSQTPPPNGARTKESSSSVYNPEDSMDANDPSSSLLRCLLSF